MPQLRFYEELNDFLPRARRKRDFFLECPAGTTMREVLETLQVPVTEVELILVNGETAPLSRPLRAEDRISVYPTFDAFDVTPLIRLRPEPLRVIRFLADGKLGGLVERLRSLGFDAIAEESESDLVARALSERRILLTRSRDVLRSRAITHGLLVRAEEPRVQLAEIMDRLQLCVPDRSRERGS